MFGQQRNKVVVLRIGIRHTLTNAADGGEVNKFPDHSGLPPYTIEANKSRKPIA